MWLTAVFLPTLLDGEVAECERHGVAGEDVVPAEHVLPVDAKAAAGDDRQHPVHVHWAGRVSFVITGITT